MPISQWFHTKQQHFTLSSALLFTTLKSHEALHTGHSRTMASFVTSYTCAQSSLATECNLKITELEIQSDTGQTCCSVIDSKLLLKHAVPPAASKSDINKTKKKQ